MQEVVLVKATSQLDAYQIASFAETVWMEHYLPIIGKAQVEYMLRKFQSVEGIYHEIKKGVTYFMAFMEGSLAGYASIKVGGKHDGLFLSKLYVGKNYRRLGIGKKFVDEAKAICRKYGYPYIWLTVNKNNPSVSAYKKIGFFITEPLCTDIGGGFYMDDYRMQLNLE